jgi:protein-S-isoprenylcysteine O-methyltransferase Ste14
MDTIRYVLGVLLVVGLPPAIFFWLLIHPLAGFWRRLGPGISYGLVTVACVVLGLAFYRFRDVFLGRDLGTSWILTVPGVGFYALSAWISILTRRQLSLRTFAGVPEIGEGDRVGVLLQEGIYGVIRHPRYLSVIIGTAGFSLFVNYLGTYVLVLASTVFLFLVIRLEELELSHRFGATYEAYRSRVPSLIPHLRNTGPRAGT